MSEGNSQKMIIEQLSQDLEDLENFLKDLWQFLPLPVCYLNPTRVVLDVNLAFEEFFGQKSIELIGQKIETLFSDKGMVERIFQAILKEKKFNTQTKVLTKYGEKIVNLSASGRYDGEGNFIGCYLALSDITELEKLKTQLEEKVKERTRELQKKVEELEKFHKLTIGRELKMIELKRAIKEVEAEIRKLKGK